VGKPFEPNPEGTDMTGQRLNMLKTTVGVMSKKL
jgi:hypothetical protein